jgi:diguanylate cyclase (GGDEF)-like protein
VKAQPLSASHASAIVEHCPFPLLVLSRSGRVSGYNPALERLLEQLPSATTGPTAADDALQTLVKCEDTLAWTEPDGQQRHFQVSSFEAPQQDSMQVRIFVDISRQVQQHRNSDLFSDDLRQQALTDPVTGLLNQHGLMLALEPQVARSRRYNSPISVIMLATQDGWREPRMLVEVARLLKDQLRWADLVGHTDRQEFILVLPETSAEAAICLAQKLERRLGELPLRLPAEQLRFGISSWHRTDSARSLVKRAAQALAQQYAVHGTQFVAC